MMAALAEPAPRLARVNTYRTQDGSDAPVELAYDVFGDRGMPLVLVMGIGAQRIFWSDALIEQFTSGQVPLFLIFQVFTKLCPAVICVLS